MKRLKRLIGLIATMFMFFGCSMQNPSINTALDSTKDSDSALEEFYDHTNIQAFDGILEEVKSKLGYLLSYIPKQCQDVLMDKLTALLHNFVGSSYISDLLGKDNIAIIDKLFQSDKGKKLENFLKENNVTLFNVDDSMFNKDFTKQDYNEFINEIEENVKTEDSITEDFADIKNKLNSSLSDVLKQAGDLKQCFINN